MKQNDLIPFYGADGTSLGFRMREVAERLIASGQVKAAYGRKGHLKAIFLPAEDGGHPVESQLRTSTRSSFLEHLNDGRRCWKLRQVDGRDENGVFVQTRGAFLQVVRDCLKGSGVGLCH